MADRIPLIVNVSAAQIQELPNQDDLVLSGRLKMEGTALGSSDIILSGGSDAVCMIANHNSVSNLSRIGINCHNNANNASVQVAEFNVGASNAVEVKSFGKITATEFHGGGTNITGVVKGGVGSDTEILYNVSGISSGSNLRYDPTKLDGGLNFANTAGTAGAAIRCYHSSITGGDNSLIFYTGGSLLGTINLRIFNNSVTVPGALTKGSGSFRIPHPLVGLSTTKDLLHSFIEGPQCDNIYRGKIDLVGGTATVNLDTKSDMTAGTFVVLNRDVQCFTTNETGWTNVMGSVSGNILTITAQDNSCTDTISWMVVGERQDDTIKSSDLTDANGKLIMEPNQIPAPPSP